MHICIISPVPIADKTRWGGIHTHTKMLAGLFVKSRIKVTLITSGYLDRAHEEIIDGVRIVYMDGVVNRTIDRTWANKVHEAFLKVNKEEPIDCIFSEGYAAYGLERELMAGKLPIVAFVHNFHLTHFYNNWKEVNSIRALISYLFKTVPKLLFRIFRYEIPFYHSCEYVISVSALNVTYLREIYRIPQDKIYVINNWVDTTVFVPNESIRMKLRKELDVPDHTLVFLLVGSLWRPKGFHVAIKSFGQFIQKTPDAILLIAGEGSQERYLKQLASRNEEINRKIRFLGSWEHNKLPSLYNAADIFLMTSLFLEAFSYVLLEAMSSGLTTIATGIGGNIELAGDAAILVQPGNRRSLTEAMLSLAKDSEKRIYLSNAARNRVLENFSEKIAIGRILAIIEKVRDGK